MAVSKGRAAALKAWKTIRARQKKLSMAGVKAAATRRKNLAAA